MNDEEEYKHKYLKYKKKYLELQNGGVPPLLKKIRYFEKKFESGEYYALFYTKAFADAICSKEFVNVRDLKSKITTEINKNAANKLPLYRVKLPLPSNEIILELYNDPEQSYESFSRLRIIGSKYREIMTLIKQIDESLQKYCVTPNKDMHTCANYLNLIVFYKNAIEVINKAGANTPRHQIENYLLDKINKTLAYFILPIPSDELTKSENIELSSILPHKKLEPSNKKGPTSYTGLLENIKELLLVQNYTSISYSPQDLVKNFIPKYISYIHPTPQTLPTPLPHQHTILKEINENLNKIFYSLPADSPTPAYTIVRINHTSDNKCVYNSDNI